VGLEPGPRQRLTRSTDRIERVGLRTVTALDPLGSVELDDDLVAACHVTAQAGAVAAGTLDRPRPKGGVLVGELHQAGVAVCGGLDGHLGEDAAGAGVNGRGGMGVDVGVDADDDVDQLTQIGQTGHAFSPLPERGRGSGPGRRFGRTVMRHTRRC
jgi:hypothetical protein